MRFVVYSRAGCHLCEEAEGVVRRVAISAEDTVEVVDIDDDEALVDAYTVRVPVVEVDGREVAQLMVDETALRRTVGR